MWPVALGGVVGAATADPVGWTAVVTALVGYAWVGYTPWGRATRAGWFPVWPAGVWLGFALFSDGFVFNPVGWVCLVGGYGVHYLVVGATRGWLAAPSMVTFLGRYSKEVFTTAGTVASLYGAYRVAATETTGVHHVESTTTVETSDAKVIVHTTETTVKGPPTKAVVFVVALPNLPHEYLHMVVPSVVAYLVGALVTYRVAQYLIRPSLEGVVPPELRGTPEVAHELSRYPRAVRLGLAHGLGMTSAVGMWTLHYLEWFLPFCPVWYPPWLFALRNTHFLQAEKLNHLAGVLEDSEWHAQDKLFHESLTLFNEGVRYTWPPVEVTPPPVETYPIGWVILGVFLGWLLHRRGQRMMFLLVPELTRLPGSAVLKLVYPVVLVGGLTWLLTRWWKRGGSPAVVVGDLLFPVGTTPTAAAHRLRQIHWWTMATPVGATGVAALDWVVILSSFRSYRFPELGATALVEAAPTVPAEFAERYHNLTERVVQVEAKMNEIYAGGVDPVAELWWLPLVRLTLVGVALGVALWWWRRGGTAAAAVLVVPTGDVSVVLFMLMLLAGVYLVSKLCSLFCLKGVLGMNGSRRGGWTSVPMLGAFPGFGHRLVETPMEKALSYLPGPDWWPTVVIPLVVAWVVYTVVTHRVGNTYFKVTHVMDPVPQSVLDRWGTTLLVVFGGVVLVWWMVTHVERLLMGSVTVTTTVEPFTTPVPSEWVTPTGVPPPVVPYPAGGIQAMFSVGPSFSGVATEVGQLNLLITALAGAFAGAAALGGYWWFTRQDHPHRVRNSVFAVVAGAVGGATLGVVLVNHSHLVRIVIHFRELLGDIQLLSRLFGSISSGVDFLLWRATPRGDDFGAAWVVLFRRVRKTTGWFLVLGVTWLLLDHFVISPAAVVPLGEDYRLAEVVNLLRERVHHLQQEYLALQGTPPVSGVPVVSVCPGLRVYPSYWIG